MQTKHYQHFTSLIALLTQRNLSFGTSNSAQEKVTEDK
jgi:hypothetical protein